VGFKTVPARDHKHNYRINWFVSLEAYSRQVVLAVQNGGAYFRAEAYNQAFTNQVSAKGAQAERESREALY
jgi:hypothetical protein